MALVNIKNVGDKEFVDSFNGFEYIIPPARELIAEEEVAATWLGWWGLRDDPARNVFDRRNTYARLRLRYGWHEGTSMSEDEWAEHRPHLEVSTLDGTRLWTVLDDPTGTKSRTRPRADLAEADLDVLRSAYEQQQSELEALRQMVEQRMAEPDGKAQPAMRDEPRRTPVGARSGPK